VKLRSLSHLAAMILLSSLLQACSPLIAAYDVEAYKAATSLKAETDIVLSHATEDFAGRAAEVEALQIKLQAAREYAAGLPLNGNSARQWEIMLDPNGGLAGETLLMWRDKGTLKPFVVAEQRKQIAEGFDYIICLEANKDKNTKCGSQAIAAATGE